MTDREKLIELIGQVQDEGRDYSDVVCVYATSNERLADHLLANGVTFAKDINVPSWIPVTERLPDTFGTFIVAVRIPTRKRTYSDSADFDPFTKKWTPSLYWGEGMNVTHWMPLPEPPKGGEA